MTRQEAIHWLESRKEHWEMSYEGQELAEALQMGIESLKTDEAYQLEYEHIPTITITVEEYIRLRECEAKCMMESEDKNVR